MIYFFTVVNKNFNFSKNSIELLNIYYVPYKIKVIVLYLYLIFYQK